MDQPTNTVFKFDCAEAEWTEGTPMPSRTSSHQVYVQHGFIYVVGGRDFDGNIIADVFRFDLHTNQWSQVAPLGDPRVVGGMFVIDGVMYAANGCDVEEDCTSRIEGYNPMLDVWQDVLNVGTIRREAVGISSSSVHMSR